MILKKMFSHTLFVRCNSHRLNLVLCRAAKVSPGISTFFCIINSLHNFMTGAHRRAKFLEIQRQMRPGQKTLELERSCDVSWSSWSNAVSKVFTLPGPMLETLATFSKSSGQTKLEADSLLRQMQTIFFFCFCLSHSTSYLKSVTVPLRACNLPHSYRQY